MSEKYSIDLGSIVDELSMKVIYMPSDGKKRPVYRAEVNRPGLPLHGYYDHFEPGRVQIFGKLVHIAAGMSAAVIGYGGETLIGQVYHELAAFLYDGIAVAGGLNRNVEPKRI